MAVYLISYALVAPGRNYDSLIRELERIGAVRVLLSAWVAELNQTAEVVRNAFQTYLDGNYRLFILELAPNAMRAGRNLIPPAADWLTRRAPGPSSR